MEKTEKQKAEQLKLLRRREHARLSQIVLLNKEIFHYEHEIKVKRLDLKKVGKQLAEIQSEIAMQKSEVTDG